jgi:hypothetical protein
VFARRTVLKAALLPKVGAVGRVADELVSLEQAGPPGRFPEAWQRFLAGEQAVAGALRPDEVVHIGPLSTEDGSRMPLSQLGRRDGEAVDAVGARTSTGSPRPVSAGRVPSATSRPS